MQSQPSQNEKNMVWKKVFISSGATHGEKQGDYTYVQVEADKEQKPDQAAPVKDSNAGKIFISTGDTHGGPQGQWVGKDFFALPTSDEPKADPVKDTQPRP